MIKIAGRKQEGTEIIYLIKEDGKRRAQWKTINDMKDNIKEIVEYELQRQSRMAVEESDHNESSSPSISPQLKERKKKISKQKTRARKLRDISKRKEMEEEGQEGVMKEGVEVEVLDVEDKRPGRFSPMRNKLRTPGVVIIDKAQFQSRSLGMFSPISPKTREVIHTAHAFIKDEVHYYSIYYADLTTELLTSEMMMQRYPDQLVSTLQKFM